MPSRVIRRSRRHGRMRNHQMAIGKPTTMTPVQVKRIAFMNVGGSVGPAGTRSKLGPLTHLIQTYSWNARMTAPTAAQTWMGLDLDWGSAPRSPTVLNDSVVSAVFLLFDSSVISLFLIR